MNNIWHHIYHTIFFIIQQSSNLCILMFRNFQILNRYAFLNLEYVGYGYLGTSVVLTVSVLGWNLHWSKSIEMHSCISYNLYGQWVGQKGSKSTGRRFEPQNKVYFFYVFTGNYTIIYLFFVTILLYNVPNRQLAGSNPSNNLCFLTFFPENIPKYNFFSNIKINSALWVLCAM